MMIITRDIDVFIISRLGDITGHNSLLSEIAKSLEETASGKVKVYNIDKVRIAHFEHKLEERNSAWVPGDKTDKSFVNP